MAIIYSGTYPYSGSNRENYAHALNENKPTMSKGSKELQSIISELIRINPTKRLGQFRPNSDVIINGTQDADKGLVFCESVQAINGLSNTANRSISYQFNPSFDGADIKEHAFFEKNGWTPETCEKLVRKKVQKIYFINPVLNKSQSIQDLLNYPPFHIENVSSGVIYKENKSNGQKFELVKEKYDGFRKLAEALKNLTGNSKEKSPNSPKIISGNGSTPPAIRQQGKKNHRRQQAKNLRKKRNKKRGKKKN